MPRTVVVGILLLVITAVVPVRGQDTPLQIEPGTEVDDVSFQGDLVLSESRLAETIATSGPSFFERLTFWRDNPYPFDPVELQKDVVRLRHLYRRRGFLHPEIDYLVDYDRDDNEIDVTFTIEPGPPLTLEDVTFAGPDSAQPAIEQFSERHQREWTSLRDRILARVGQRFENAMLLSIETELQTWLQNAGYPFAQITSDTTIVHRHEREDPATYTDVASISIQVDAGPLAYISEFEIQGNTSLERNVILRNIPVDVGEQFSQQALNQAQHQLFSLNLFRMALVDVPPQSRDSTVTVRIRLQEAEPRYISAETGYSFARGINLEGQWRHRNFLGDARNLIVSTSWSTGMGAFQRADVIAPSQIRVGASLRQPYLLTARLSGLISPFYQRREEQAFALEQYGLNTTLIYDFYRFRTLSFQHTFSRTAPLQRVGLPVGRFFNRSALILSGRFGRANDYINPQDGYLIEPFVENSNRFIGSALEYVKAGVEGSVYELLTDEVGIASRLFLGRLFPYGASADPDNPIIAARMRSIRFYAGGSNDVRGWQNQLLGPKIVVDTTTTADDFQFIPLGGLTKVATNFEVRLPFPFLGDNWGTTAFIDAGFIGEDNLPFDPADYRYGAGGGIRYGTAVGPVRFDVAYKLNPDPLDVRPPQPGAEPSVWRRIAFYFTIGNPF